jgi:hypothetical protein
LSKFRTTVDFQELRKSFGSREPFDRYSLIKNVVAARISDGTGNPALFASQPRRKTMISKWKVAAIIITTVAKMAIVSPAFAQSFDPDEGTGNVLMLNNQATVPHKQAAVRRSGIDAFAMVPRVQAGVASEDPANTGGGSIGYNENLRAY